MIQTIDDFLLDTQEELIEVVLNELNISKIDRELSQVYDSVSDKFYNVSIDDIIKTTVNRIRTGIRTFEVDEDC